MRYIDTGSRNPNHTLGRWFESVLSLESKVTSMRVQTGFFGSHTLGYFKPVLGRLGLQDSVTRLLIGSNDGSTTRRSLEELLKAAGSARGNLSIGVVSFANAYFHPKVYHFEREDGSMTAYIGSANLTRNGVSKHVESGIVLDTRDGDSTQVLADVGLAIDAWFVENRAGLFPVATSDDLVALADAQIIDVAKSVTHPRVLAVAIGDTKSAAIATLTPMLKLPTAENDASSDSTSNVFPAVVTNAWSKTLSPSDAQRKPAGNQRGAITLVQGDLRGQVDHHTYFRYELFEAAPWTPTTSNTGKPLDRAFVQMAVTVDGVPIGRREVEVTYAPNREAKQRNYTSTLHLESLAAEFQQQDLTGWKLLVEALSDGSFRLSISR